MKKKILQGDSGGPLMLKKDKYMRLMAVISHGHSEFCATGKPAVNTNVYPVSKNMKHIDIKHNIKHNYLSIYVYKSVFNNK
jgi:secreted trypsin-like serine protease